MSKSSAAGSMITETAKAINLIIQFVEGISYNYDHLNCAASLGLVYLVIKCRLLTLIADNSSVWIFTVYRVLVWIKKKLELSSCLLVKPVQQFLVLFI